MLLVFLLSDLVFYFLESEKHFESCTSPELFGVDVSFSQENKAVVSASAKISFFIEFS